MQSLVTHHVQACSWLGDMFFLAIITALTLPNSQMCKLRLRKGKGVVHGCLATQKGRTGAESRSPTLSLCPNQSTSDLALAPTWVASGSHLRSHTIKSKR